MKDTKVTVVTVVAALLPLATIRDRKKAVWLLAAATSRATTLPRLAAAFMLALGINLFPGLRFMVESSPAMWRKTQRVAASVSLRLQLANLM